MEHRVARGKHWVIYSRELVDRVRREALRERQSVDISLAGRKPPYEFDCPDVRIAWILLRRVRTQVFIACVSYKANVSVEPSLDELEDPSEDPFRTRLDANLNRFHAIIPSGGTPGPFTYLRCSAKSLGTFAVFSHPSLGR